MMRYTFFVLFLVGLFAFQCGPDPAEEGKKLFLNKDYTEAIKLLIKAKQADSTNKAIDEMICLAFLYRGEELFEKTKNVKAFQGNFKEANNYLPEVPSADFTKQYNELRLALASAYLDARARNDDEEEQFFETALNIVKDIISSDSTNASAKNLLAKLKADHFQNLVDKGANLYKKAGRTRNYDLYYTAEYYLKEAQKFESDNKQILNLLQKIKQKTLPVLNYREGISMAVAGISYERKGILMTLTIKNYTSNPLNLDIKKFKLIDRQGNSFGINEQEMQKRELFGENCIKSALLNEENPAASGVIAFDAPQDIKIAYVNYTIDSKRFVRKYFP